MVTLWTCTGCDARWSGPAAERVKVGTRWELRRLDLGHELVAHVLDLGHTIAAERAEAER